MTEQRPEKPPTIRSVKRVSYRNALGQIKEGILIKWSDGQKSKHRSEKSLRPAVQKQLVEFERRSTKQAAQPDGVPGKPKTARQLRVRRKHLGGYGWGTVWKSNQDGVFVSWPTIPLATPLGFTGLFACTIYVAASYFKTKAVGPYPAWLIVAIIVCVGMLISSRLLRESFFLSYQRAERSRWPDLFKRKKVVPFSEVINVVIQLDIIHGEHTRRLGTVKIRVKRPGGIQWWPLGTGLNWSEAKSIGQLLSRYTDIRIIDNT